MADVSSTRQTKCFFAHPARNLRKIFLSRNNNLENERIENIPYFFFDTVVEFTQTTKERKKCRDLADFRFKLGHFTKKRDFYISMEKNWVPSYFTSLEEFGFEKKEKRNRNWNLPENEWEKIIEENCKRKGKYEYLRKKEINNKKKFFEKKEEDYKMEQRKRKVRVRCSQGSEAAVSLDTSPIRVQIF